MSSNRDKTFDAFCNDQGEWAFDHPAQVNAFIAAKFRGCELVFTVEDRALAKTRLQESGFHAMLKPWLAEGHSIEALKYALKKEIFGLKEVVNQITGEVTEMLREPHTSTLNKAQYSELIERSLEIAAGCGVILEAPSEYKERKRKEAQAAAKKAKRAA